MLPGTGANVAELGHELEIQYTVYQLLKWVPVCACVFVLDRCACVCACVYYACVCMCVYGCVSVCACASMCECMNV